MIITMSCYDRFGSRTDERSGGSTRTHGRDLVGRHRLSWCKQTGRAAGFPSRRRRLTDERRCVSSDDNALPLFIANSDLLTPESHVADLQPNRNRKRTADHPEWTETKTGGIASKRTNLDHSRWFQTDVLCHTRVINCTEINGIRRTRRSVFRCHCRLPGSKQNSTK